MLSGRGTWPVDMMVYLVHLMAAHTMAGGKELINTAEGSEGETIIESPLSERESGGYIEKRSQGGGSSACEKDEPPFSFVADLSAPPAWLWASWLFSRACSLLCLA